MWSNPRHFRWTPTVQLQIVYKMDSSFAGVLQDLLVLFVLLGQGVRERVLRKV